MSEPVIRRAGLQDGRTQPWHQKPGALFLLALCMPAAKTNHQRLLIAGLINWMVNG